MRTPVDVLRITMGFPIRVTNALFGYDFFIAYSRRDGADYAESLDAALSSDFSVHFDVRDYHIGDDLDLLTKIRLRNSRHLVVVATPDALSESTWVKNENDQFVAAQKRPLIVDVDGAVDAALLTPRTDKLSGWIQNTRKVQGDGTFIDPILRLPDDSGHRVNGVRVASQDVISKLKASYTGARVAQRRLLAVSAVAIALFGLLLTTAWLANAAYKQLVAAVSSRSENAAVAAISLADQGFTPEALIRAQSALPNPSRWVQAYDPLSISAAVAVLNGLAIGASKEMVFHIQDADLDPSGTMVATVETDFTEGASNVLPKWGRLWSVSTGALIGQVRLPDNASFAVEVLSDHRTAIYGGFAGKLVLWNFDSETAEPFDTDENMAAITEIVSRDGLNLFGVGSSSGIHVFDFQSKQGVGHVFLDYDKRMSSKPDQSFDLHPGGSLLAAQTVSGFAVFDFVENTTRCSIPNGGNNFVSMRFSPDGRRLGLISEDGSTFAVEFSETAGCSELRPLPISAADGEFLCGRFPAEETNLAFIDHKPWILQISRELYHAENMYCAYLYDWEREKTLSTVLLGRGYAPLAQAFLGVDEPHPVHRDLSNLHRLSKTSVSENLDMFSYRRTLPGGVFVRRRWLRIDPQGITLAQDVTNDTINFQQRVARDPTAQSWDCNGYDTGPNTETIAVSQSGRFAVVAEPLAIRMHDRETCTIVGIWSISMVRTAQFVDEDSALSVMNAQRQVFRLPLPTSLVDEGLAQRLQQALAGLE